MTKKYRYIITVVYNDTNNTLIIHKAETVVKKHFAFNLINKKKNNLL